MIKTIPLDKLVASPRNVRRSTDAQADAQLKSDIASRGLLQNLVVTSVRKPRGCFAVEAGERRRTALQSLADDGLLAMNYPVCCLVVDLPGAQEASLAENFQRLAMNPADECLAFQQLVAQGGDAETIARRFGLGTRFVDGRLRLADLAPEIFAALGAGEIGLDVAKAYAATPDRERQSYVFEQAARSYMGNHPDSIRRMMTQATVGGDDRRALFVGEADYVDAGGRIERDLFADHAQSRWLDVAILDRLAFEKLEAAAAHVAADRALAFVRPTLGSWVPYSETEGLRRMFLDPQPLSDEEQAEVDDLEAQVRTVNELLEDEDATDETRSAAEVRLQALDAAIAAIADKEPVIPDELQGKIGAFLLLDEEGRPVLDRSFYMPIPEGTEAPAAQERLEENDPPTMEARKHPLARRLADELAMQRRDILAARVAAEPAFARDLATFLMLDRQWNHASGGSGSTLSAARPSDPVFDFATPEARATIALAEVEGRLERGWTEGATHAERFDAFRALSKDARDAWLAFAVARTLEASAFGEQRPCAFHDHLGTVLGIDVAAWWRPDGVNFFDRVPKAMALAALTDVGGAELAGRHAKAKKAELAQACERVFAGDLIADVEVKQAALAWVPEAMRFGAPGDSDVPDGAGEEDMLSAGKSEAPLDADPPAEEFEEAA